MRLLFGILVACSALATLGCTSIAEIRIENVSKRAYTNVSISGQDYGDIPAGAITDYKKIPLRGRYASLKLSADGRYITGQTLNFGSRRFTYRIDIADFEKRQLHIEMQKDSSGATD